MKQLSLFVNHFLDTPGKVTVWACAWCQGFLLVRDIREKSDNLVSSQGNREGGFQPQSEKKFKQVKKKKIRMKQKKKTVVGKKAYFFPVKSHAKCFLSPRS